MSTSIISICHGKSYSRHIVLRYSYLKDWLLMNNGLDELIFILEKFICFDEWFPNGFGKFNPFEIRETFS